MSKLSRKAKVKEKKEEQSGKKALIYLGIGLAILAIIFGFLFS